MPTLLGLAGLIGAFVFLVYKKDQKRQVKFNKWLKDNNLTREEVGL